MPEARPLADILDDDRDEQATKHGDAAQARDGPAVDATRTWFIDDAVSLREAPDERHERDCRGKGDGEDQQVVYPRLHAAQYTAFSHTARI